MMARAATQAGQAPLEVLVEVALDGTTGDIGVGGDVVVAEAVALEPEHLHLPLDPGVGVMVTVVGQVFPDFCWEGERSHDGDSMLSPGHSPSVVYLRPRPPTICDRPGRAEYIRSCSVGGVRKKTAEPALVIAEAEQFDRLAEHLRLER